MRFADSWEQLLRDEVLKIDAAFHRAFWGATLWSRVRCVDEGMPPSLSDIFVEGGAPFEATQPFLREKMLELLMSPHSPLQSLPLYQWRKGVRGFDEPAYLARQVEKYVHAYEIG